MKQAKIQDYRDKQKIKKIFVNAFNADLDNMVERSLELPTSFTSKAPHVDLGEATQCFNRGFFNASVALSRATLEQVLKNKLSINEREVVDLSCLIKLATAQKVLKNNLKSEAIKIQKWGNAYIHNTKKKDTKYTQQKNRSKEVLLSIKKIIEALYP